MEDAPTSSESGYSTGENEDVVGNIMLSLHAYYRALLVCVCLWPYIHNPPVYNLVDKVSQSALILLLPAIMFMTTWKTPRSHLQPFWKLPCVYYPARCHHTGLLNEYADGSVDHKVALIRTSL